MPEDREIQAPEGDGDVVLGASIQPAALDAKIDTVSREIPRIKEEELPALATTKVGSALSPKVEEGILDKANVDEAKQAEKDRKNTEFKSVLPTILEKIHDPNYPLEEVNRLISIEIALVAQEMSIQGKTIKGGDLGESFLQKSFDQRVKALQALEKSLTNTDVWRNRDILNIDGPKFQYMFAEIVNVFRRASSAALGKNSDTMVQSIMKHFRDEMAMREADLRREVDKIDSAAKGK